MLQERGYREQEIRVPGLELRTLMSMENVTDRVNGAVKAGMDDAAAGRARKAELDAIQKEMQDRTGLSVEPVTLYQGGEYWMYGYKKHTDVRLVMAPEMQIAFFGGDPDNFTYPRHNLDFTLFRIYEDGKPFKPAHWLSWSPAGVKNGELTFVAGHPGSTARLETHAQMLYGGTVALPQRIAMAQRQREALLAYAAQGPENARQVNTQIFGLENSIKAMTGYLSGLQNQEAMARIAAYEADLRAKVNADPRLRERVGGSWAAIERALETQKALAKEYAITNNRHSTLLLHALTLVRLADEIRLPQDKRLPEYKDTNLEGVKKRLLVQRPYYPALETALFTHGLREAVRELGAGHPFVQALLDGKSPEEVAKAAVEGSRLGDPAVRKALLEKPKAILASKDPMILLARRIDGPNRELRRRMEELVEAVLVEHGGRIAAARFAIYGKSRYPDATLTLRLTYGPVAGYPANGTLIQPFTTFYGLYDRAEGWGPEAQHGAWSLPKRWIERKDRLNLATPFDFSHAVDIIGGNSGSPVVNREGRLVGLTFDGNIESLPGRFFYDGKVNRGLAVDARAILEALDKVYDARNLVKEILAR
jgi:hypothetical protein